MKEQVSCTGKWKMENLFKQEIFNPHILSWLAPHTISKRFEKRLKFPEKTNIIEGTLFHVSA
jgi:hypothetical protein